MEFDLAFVLHSRPYTDSKAIVNLLTKEHGRISGVVRVPKKKNSSREIQAFSLLNVGCHWKQGLKTLLSIEPEGIAFPLHGDALFCGMYLNELLQRLLPEDDACTSLFNLYQIALKNLQEMPGEREVLEPILRSFELSMLAELGYGVDFFEDSSGERITQGGFYQFNARRGFSPIDPHVASSESGPVFSAKIIEQLAAGDVSSGAVRPYVKYVCRQVLASHLGSKPLKSRELFLR